MAFTTAAAMALSGGLQAASGLVGGLITSYGKQRRSQQKLNAWNFENITKPQMEIEQEYNQRNMALQNQYQIEAENRANAYNDPSAQLARARQAGMNPQAVMSDAGVQGSISSGPSSDSPSVSSPANGSAGTKDYSALGKMDIAGAILSARKAVQEYNNAKQQQENQNNLTQAEVNVKNAEADRLRGQEHRDSGLFEDIQRRTKALADTAEEQAEVARLDKEFAEAVQNMRIDKFEVELANARKDGKIKDEIYNNYVAQTALAKANRGLVVKQTETEEARKENIDANTETENLLRESRLQAIKADIDKSASASKLTDAQRMELAFTLYRRMKFIPDPDKLNKYNLAAFYGNRVIASDAEFERLLQDIEAGNFDKVLSTPSSGKRVPNLSEGYKKWKEKRGYK